MDTQTLTHVSAQISRRDREALESLARREDRTVSYLVRRAVREHIERVYTDMDDVDGGSTSSRRPRL